MGSLSISTASSSPLPNDRVPSSGQSANVCQPPNKQTDSVPKTVTVPSLRSLLFPTGSQLITITSSAQPDIPHTATNQSTRMKHP
mmetsp:Transcript_47202/g.117803  ORF Transcript_47202/g.117803 Transcript_47202/m.117803 type:complete len:85 (-) Transcript_47202:1048-1302(-)